MASGMVRRAMVYLGLVDDDYEDYEAYEEPPPRAVRARRPGPIARGGEMGGSGLPGVRTIPRVTTRPVAA